AYIKQREFVVVQEYLLQRSSGDTVTHFAYTPAWRKHILLSILLHIEVDVNELSDLTVGPKQPIYQLYAA
ncbi:MAG: hypothetical protein ACE5NW_12210, partial [Acidiferrobacterales bacterium]